MQPDGNVGLSANLVGLSAGQGGAPVLGSGVFVSGFGDAGGGLNVQRLETESAYSNGMIPPDTADLISGGIFSMEVVDVVQNNGPVTTYGANDMALDNSGPSGIGFVNIGTIGFLQAHASIETFGEGARGLNVYTGTMALGEFDRFVTHGDMR